MPQLFSAFLSQCKSEPFSRSAWHGTTKTPKEPLLAYLRHKTSIILMCNLSIYLQMQTALLACLLLLQYSILHTAAYYYIQIMTTLARVSIILPFTQHDYGLAAGSLAVAPLSCEKWDFNPIQHW
jgi:hypothetical protein